MRFYSFFYALGLGVATFGVGSQTAHAASYTVLNGDDSGPGSLREGVTLANASIEADTISFAPGVSTIQLQSALPTLTGEITIDGPVPGPDEKQLEIRGNSGNNMRIIEVSSGSSASVREIRFLFSGNSGNGGTFLNSGTLALHKCFFNGSSAKNGGAIYNDASGTLNLDGCVFYSNSASFGGAVYNAGQMTAKSSIFQMNLCSTGAVYAASSTENGGVTTLENCTLFRNQVLEGAALQVANGKVRIDSCTIAQNWGREGSPGGLIVSAQTQAHVDIVNSVIAGNTINDASQTGLVDVDSGQSNSKVTFISGGHNVIGDVAMGTTAFTAEGDKVNVPDGALKLWADSGPSGALQKLEPAWDSVLIDAGSTNLGTDSLGTARPQRGADDVGAVEKIANTPPEVVIHRIDPQQPVLGNTLSPWGEYNFALGPPQTLTVTWSRTRGNVTEVVSTEGGGLLLDPAFYRVGDVLTFTATISDGYFTSTSSKSVTIAPRFTISEFRLQPRAPYTDERMIATVKAKVNQGVRLNYNWTWTRNGDVVRNVTNRNSQDFYDLNFPGRGNKGDVIAASVVVTDELSQETVSASTIVRNTAPVLSQLTLPPTITPNGTIISTYNGRDADGDDLTRRYVWRIGTKTLKEENGSRLNLAKYPFVKPGDVVSVELQLSDGEARSKTLKASVIVAGAVAEALPSAASS